MLLAACLCVPASVYAEAWGYSVKPDKYGPGTDHPTLSPYHENFLDDAPWYDAVAPEAGTRIYLYPDTSSYVLTRMPVKAWPQTCEFDGEFCYVRYNLYEGFVLRSDLVSEGRFGKYLFYGDDLGMGKIVNCKKSVSLRPYPNAQFDADGQLPLGTTVHVYAYNEDFYRCETGDGTGFVKCEYVQLLGSGKSSYSGSDDSQYESRQEYGSTGSAGVPATPNQKLAFRTGPNTKYVELYTLPASTSITAIEYEEGNDVTWVLVEYTRDGSVCRAYTGLKRMTVHGSIPWANHNGQQVTIHDDCTVLAAPSSRGAYRSKLFAGETVTILEYESDMVFVEFYDTAYGAPNRGYIPAWAIENSSAYSGSSGQDWYHYGGNSDPMGTKVICNCDEWVSLRETPSTSARRVAKVPLGAEVEAFYYSSEWYECNYNGLWGYIKAEYVGDW